MERPLFFHTGATFGSAPIVVLKKGIGDNTPMPFDYFTQALTFSGLALIQSFAACFGSFPF